MSYNYSPYSRSILEGLDEPEREKLLHQLENKIAERMSAYSNPNAFSQEIEAVIADLKKAGHDLHSHDVAGTGKELWGWNYMQPEDAGHLQIQFEFPNKIKIFWKTKNPQNTFEDSDN